MAVQALFTERSGELSLELKYLIMPYDNHPMQTPSMFKVQEAYIFHLHLHNQVQLAWLQLLCTKSGQDGGL